MSGSSSSSTVLLARQPIFDRRLGVHAYELLYRGKGLWSAGDVGMRESAATLVRAIVEIGLEKLVGTKPAYINVPHYLLGEPSIRLLPPDRVVLEILEDTEPTSKALDEVQELQKIGYKIALDDFVFGSPQTEFLPFVKIVKVDLIQNTGRQLVQTVDLLKRSKVKMLAEKVETLATFDHCQGLGFHYFQGYFCAKPEIVSGKSVPASLGVLLSVLNRVQDCSVSLSELEQMITLDVGLTYRLLRMVNSVIVNPNDVVDSVRAALLILGLERVRQLASLLALAEIDSKPDELVVTAMVRAKMCETIAPVLGHENPARHFTVGLLSVLDLMLDMPMGEILRQIPLSSEIKDVLVNRTTASPLGETLNLALAYEKGNWEEIDAQYHASPTVNECYLDAVQWADQTASELKAA